MQGLRLCSKQSKEPYEILEMNIKIYSIEELAYFIYHYSFFVEEDFVSAQLAEYIQTQLGMPQLAGRLSFLMGQKQSFCDKLIAILDASGYYEVGEIQEYQREMNQFLKKSKVERMLMKVDFFYEEGRLSDSENTLLRLLELAEEKSPYELSQIYYKIGKIQIRRFQFQMGRETFAKAYGCYRDPDIGRALVNSILLMQDYEGESSDTLKNVVVEQLGLVHIPEQEILFCIDELKRTALRGELESGYEGLESCSALLKKRKLDAYYQCVWEMVASWKDEYRRSFAHEA